MKALTLLVPVLFLFNSSCANLSTHQTARALPLGTARGIFGFGIFKSPTIKTQISNTLETETELRFPFVEFGARVGLAKNLEGGAKYTVPGSLAGDLKFQWLDLGKFVAAIGVGGSYLGVTSQNSSSSTTAINTSFIDLIVPIYFSYDFFDWGGIYLSPKFVCRLVLGKDSGNTQMAGSTVGFRLGNRAGVFLEATLLKDLKNPFNQAQANIGIFFGPSPSVPDSETEEK